LDGPACELGDEEGAASGFESDGGGLLTRVGVVAADQLDGELIGFGIAQGSDDEVEDVCAWGAAVGGEGAHHGGGLCVFDAVGADEQQRRGLRWAHQLEQQLRAVGVAPLQIVEEEHEPSGAREAIEQRAQGEERLASQERRRGDSLGGLGDLANGRYASQHGEDARHGPGVVGDDCRAVAIRESQALAAQRVDQRVEGLVGHLALVGATAHHRRPVVLREPVEEVPDHRRLAHAG